MSSEISECLACSSKNLTPWLTDCPDVYRQTAIRVSYLRCTDCETIQVQSVPNNLLENSYEDYPIHQKKSSFFNFVRRLLTGSMYFRGQALKDAKLLDFGSGDGFYLSSVPEAKTRVGFEINPKHAQNLSNELHVAIYSDESKLIEDFGDKIDVLTMHMVLEHLPNLKNAFHLANQMLSKNRLFYFVIPNPYSWESLLFKKYWHGLDAPRHLVFPSDQGIALLAKSADFEVVRKRFHFFPNGVAGSLAGLPNYKYSTLLFYLFLPIGIIASFLRPTGVVSYELRKI